VSTPQDDSGRVKSDHDRLDELYEARAREKWLLEQHEKARTRRRETSQWVVAVIVILATFKDVFAWAGKALKSWLGISP
jgi:hypothetical protein